MKTKRGKKSSAAQVIDVAVETDTQTMLDRAQAQESESTPAQELPAVEVPAVETPKSPEPVKPFRFAKGTEVRFRSWDKAEGPLDREGTVTGHGPKWITVRRKDGKQDWTIMGQCEAIEVSQTA